MSAGPNYWIDHLSRTKTTKIVDAVYANNVIGTVRCERVRGVKAKGWASC
jgi:hypothetical protein